MYFRLSFSLSLYQSARNILVSIGRIMKFILGMYLKLCWQNWNLIQITQKHQTLYMMKLVIGTNSLKISPIRKVFEKLCIENQCTHFLSNVCFRASVTFTRYIRKIRQVRAEHVSSNSICNKNNRFAFREIKIIILRAILFDTYCSRQDQYTLWLRYISHERLYRQIWRLIIFNSYYCKIDYDYKIIWHHITWIEFSYIFPHGATAPRGSGTPHYQDFTITLRHILLARAPLKPWTRRGDLYLKTFITHKKKTFTPQVGFEPTIPTTELSQTNTFDCMAAGMTENVVVWRNNTWVDVVWPHNFPANLSIVLLFAWSIITESGSMKMWCWYTDYLCLRHGNFLCYSKTYTDMGHFTTRISSEKCVFRLFRRCANVY